MINRLVRLFIQDCDNVTDPAVREKYGVLSGAVEPVFALMTLLCAGLLQPVMPWLLSFAAGAMLYVVVEELIPHARLDGGSRLATLGVMAGFLLMMILDVALG